MKSSVILFMFSKMILNGAYCYIFNNIARRKLIITFIKLPFSRLSLLL